VTVEGRLHVKIVGLDLSLTGTGYARPDDTTFVLATKKRGEERLDWLQSRLADAIAEDVPDLIAIEGYTFQVNDTSTRSIAELHGVVRLMLWRWKQPWFYVNPMHVKMYALGKAGKKEQMLAEAQARFGRRFATNDECDAYWLRAMTLDWYGEPLCAMPVKNRSYLERVGFPAREGA
jgi:Holliday junction resolvasome RuvABC endonuclease subunit